MTGFGQSAEGRTDKQWEVDRDRVRGVGRAIFAAVFLMIGGVLNIIYGIAAISKSHVFAHNTHYVFASLRGWGWVTLIIGIIELLAAFSLLGGGTFGRWFGIFAGSLAALAALLSIPADPLLALAIFALSLWIIHGFVVYGEPEPATPTGRASGT